MVVSNISGANYQPQVLSKSKSVNSLSLHRYNKADSVSFSSASQLRGEERLKVRMQRIWFNFISRNENTNVQKTIKAINSMAREELSPSGIKNAMTYCKETGAELVAPVQLTLKSDGKPVTGFLVMRRVDAGKEYSKGVDFKTLPKKDITKELVKGMLQSFVDSKGKTESFSSRLRGFPKGIGEVAENSCHMEVLDPYGLPIGTHFLDVNKDVVWGKGILNLEPDTYSGIGRLLNDAKSLIAHLTGSKKVTMITFDNTKGFNEKCGYRLDPTKKPCGAGDWMHLPKDQLNAIVAKHEGSELYLGLSQTLKKLGFIKD